MFSNPNDFCSLNDKHLKFYFKDPVKKKQMIRTKQVQIKAVFVLFKVLSLHKQYKILFCPTVTICLCLATLSSIFFCIYNTR